MSYFTIQVDIISYHLQIVADHITDDLIHLRFIFVLLYNIF